MSLRELMHPENKYKIPPDFKRLTILHPEFQKIAITDLTGKVKVDFKNQETLRILTKVLLKHDFDLEVEIPSNKLVPTLPLRLNYVLWIKDLMTYSSFKMEEVTGIDIGTGAVCIYPLLFAKIYGCRMIGTEIDRTSLASATSNVESNNLQNLVKVVAANNEGILEHAVKERQSYHFMMCNPPFFESEETVEGTRKQLSPRNAPTGEANELTTRGGEKSFVTRMIEESIQHGDKIKIYTTMLGKRSNLLFLIKFMKRKNIQNTTWTEFCQGYTKRWCLAWTFLSKDIVNLTKAPVIRESDVASNSWKKLVARDIVFPVKDNYSCVDDAVILLKKWMDELCIQVNELNVNNNKSDCWRCKLVAANDSWSHARRKRRLIEKQRRKSETLSEENNSREPSEEAINAATDTKDTDMQNEDQTCTEKSKFKEPLLVCSLLVQMLRTETSETGSIKICMIFESGSGGKNAMETFRQYLINKFDIREHFMNQAAKCNKKRRRYSKKMKRNVESSANELQAREFKD